MAGSRLKFVFVFTSDTVGDFILIFFKNVIVSNYNNYSVDSSTMVESGRSEVLTGVALGVRGGVVRPYPRSCRCVVWYIIVYYVAV